MASQRRFGEPVKPKATVAARKNQSPVRAVPSRFANTTTVPKPVASALEATSLALQEVGNTNRVIDIQRLQGNVFNVHSSKLFEDEDFECKIENLSSDFRTNANVDWFRPVDINAAASLIGSAESEFSMPAQQQLGDCWFVCASYALANSLGSRFFKRVCLKNESGLLVFRFFVKGLSTGTYDFLDITIDDRLPVRKLLNAVSEVVRKDLVYGRCVDEKQFWFPLLEKAYTKLYGSNFENIVSGVPEEAFIDLCGAFTLYLNPKDNADSSVILSKLVQMKQQRRLIACADTIPLEAKIVNGTGKMSTESRKSHSFVVLDVTSQASANEDTIVHLKNVWSSSNMFFKELWNLNCKKKQVNNQYDYSDLHLKLRDFQNYFGALTLVLSIPDASKADYTELCGSFHRSYSLKEVSTSCEHKDAFLNYLQETCEFYLLEIQQLKQQQTEILFNLTQYASTLERQKLRLCIIEIQPEALVANYSNRLQANRNGRTLSKLLSITKRNASYLLIVMSISNDKEEQHQGPINYLLRCLHSDLTRNEIQFRKLNDNLANETIKLDMNACHMCSRVLISEIYKKKVHQKDKNKVYCEECNSKEYFGKPMNAFDSLINAYESIL